MRTRLGLTITVVLMPALTFAACSDSNDAASAHGRSAGSAGEGAEAGDGSAAGGKAPGSGGSAGGNRGGNSSGGATSSGGAGGDGGGAPANGGTPSGEGGSFAEGDAGAASGLGGAADGGDPAVGGSAGEEGDPCQDVTCDAPPANGCEDGVLSSYVAAGTCSEGVCEYEPLSVACTHGCESTECSCTPDDTTLVEASAPMPTETSMGVDSQGGLHIAYWADSGLQYSFRAASGSWVSDTLDPDAPSQVGWYPSLFIDAEDGVHIAYGLVSIGGIRYAHRAVTDSTFDFSVEPADEEGGTGLDISLAVDAEGGVHIAHHNGEDVLYTYKPPGGAFATHPLSPPGTAFNTGTSLAIGPDGTVYIAFANAQDNTCQLATKSGDPATFDYSDIEATEASPALAVDQDGGLHVALHDLPLVDNVRYRYRAPGSATWQEVPVDLGLVGPAAIAVDRFGGVHLSYLEMEPGRAVGDLKYAHKPPGGSFSSRILDGSAEGEAAGEYSSIATDGSGVAHVSYAHRSEDTLYYVRACPAE